MAYCNACGQQINDTAKFCKYCGAKVDAMEGVDVSEVIVEEKTAQVGAAYQGQPTSAGATQQPYQVPGYAGSGQGHNDQAYASPNGTVHENTKSVKLDMGSDHTSMFSPEDISKNKVFAIGSYLLGFLGIIVALLAARESKFAMFHARESMKIIVVELLIGLITLLLFWTVLVPIAASICYIILAIVQLICVIRTCKGEAKMAPIVGSMKFLN